MVIAVQDLKIAYAAVPKAGCSSVKAMLAQLDPQADVPHDVPDNRFYHSLYPTRRFRPRRFPATEGIFSFTVVRDPIRRLMSVYTNRVADKGDLHNSRKLKKRKVLPLDPDPDTFFQNLARYCRLSSVIRHHVLPTAIFTGRNLNRYDRVFRTDQIDELADALSSHCTGDVRPARANSSKSRLAFDDLKPETRDAIRPHLLGEYRHLSGYIDNPFD